MITGRRVVGEAQDALHTPGGRNVDAEGLSGNEFPGVEFHLGLRAIAIVAAALGAEPGGGVHLRNLLQQFFVPNDDRVKGDHAVIVRVGGDIDLHGHGARLPKPRTGMFQQTSWQRERRQQCHINEMDARLQSIPYVDNHLEGTTRGVEAFWGNANLQADGTKGNIDLISAASKT